MNTIMKYAIPRFAAALLLTGLFAPAATAEVDTLIAQFPAHDAAAANQLFDALIDLGEDAIEDLCDRLVPMGEGDDNPARYALVGLARYASRPDAGHDREVVEEGLLEGLENTKKPEIQAFLLRQLQQCGTNNTVSEISGLLESPAVASHTILTLDAIDTWRARRALTKALRKTTGDTQLQILAALADNGHNGRVTRTARARLHANPDADEYVHLLSILVDVAGDKAHADLIAAMDREEPRIRKAALGHAATMMDRYAERKWRKKVLDKQLPDAVKRDIGALLASNE